MDHAAALLAENAALADLVDGADWSAPVPTCPGWTLLQLLKHTGRGDRWAAQIVAERRQEPLDPREVEGGRPPDDEPGALAWLRGSPHTLLDAVAVDPAAPVWTFTGPQPATWWVRRRLHEATVHRADAALAVGATYAIDEDLAADGVAEWLYLMASRPRGADGTAPLDDGATLALVTDHGAAWVARGTTDGLQVEPGTGPADATVTAPAADLLLALSRRGERGSVGGDGRVWRDWLARTPF